ncbi:MFS transporter [Nonomuraea sp. NPDC050556]|uniref:MFS transporter n=1 Tax=Nonomuraea sp. NPDC050556 TaxID=3364369 RepID=UPI00378E6531
MVASLLGDASLLLVPAILVKKWTGSSSAAGLTLFFFTLPLCFSPLFGVVVDRVDRRRLLVVACLVSAVSLVPLGFASAVWVVYVVSACMGCSYTVVFGALGGLLKGVLPGGLLAQSNGALQVARQGARVVGPVVGVGLLSWVGVWGVVVFDMATFVVAAGAFWRLRLLGGRFPLADRPHSAVRADEGGAGWGRWWREVGAGVVHVWGDVVLRRVLGSLGLMFVVGGVTESLIFAVIEGLGRPPEFTAVTGMAMGVGAIVGGVLAAWLVGRFGEAAVVGAGVALYGVAVALWLIPAAWALVGAMGVAGASLTATAVAVRTVMQRRTPEGLLGRVSAAYDAMAGMGSLASVGVGAVLVSVVDARVLVGCVAVAIVCAGLPAWRVATLSPNAVSSGRSGPHHP